MPYAEIALNVPAPKSFTYHIPTQLENQLTPGSLVRVEFGVAMQPGIVLSLPSHSDIPQTKPVIELLDPQPALSAEYLALAHWLSETCLAPIGACVWLMLPPGFAGKSDRQYDFVREQLPTELPQQLILPGAPKSLLPLPQRLIEYLRDKGPKRLKQLKSAFPEEPIEAELERLTTAGVLEAESVLAPPTARHKLVKRLYPNYAPEEIPALVKSLGKSNKAIALLELIAERDEDAIGVGEALNLVGAKSRAPLNRLLEEGLVFIEKTERGAQDLIILEAAPDRIERLLETWRGTAFYAQILRQIAQLPQAPTLPQALSTTDATRPRLKKLIRAGLLQEREEQIWRDSLRDFDFVPRQAPTLTPDQQDAWEQIQPALQRRETARFLLHGVTGSGKTEIYLRAIAEIIEQGRAAIFLVPEIALTPQTIRRVSERFPEQVAIVHGSLPIGERYDTWQRARAGALSVIVGTRSALFTPLPKLGLIILDEEHDASYKQSPGMSQPHYHARAAADYLAGLKRATLILGSATPDMGSWYRTRKGHFHYLRLPKRIIGHRQRIDRQADRLGIAPRYQEERAEALTIELPPVDVVDMRRELRAGNTSMFSRALKRSLAEVLERGEQAMLLLNRRGQASYVFCRDCGGALACPRCDIPLTYHRIDRSLRCHHCGASQAQPSACPACGSSRIRYFGAGTQQVEGTLASLFPAARTLRWDLDTANSPRHHFEILSQFIDRQADVLIGTQMIAKGLDLPLVTLVAVVSADLGLALPDYRAAERVFQLLTQVSGRAGRGLLGGNVILQTYQPEHYAIVAASQHDYAGFIERESGYRQKLGYPPYRRLARIVFSYRSADKAREQAEYAARRLSQIIQERALGETSIIGPAPCFFTRIDRQYRWQLLLRAPDPLAALRELKSEPGWQIDIDPVDVL